MPDQRGDEPRWFCLYQQQRDPIHQVHASLPHPIPGEMIRQDYGVIGDPERTDCGSRPRRRAFATGRSSVVRFRNHRAG